MSLRVVQADSERAAGCARHLRVSSETGRASAAAAVAARFDMDLIPEVSSKPTQFFCFQYLLMLCSHGVCEKIEALVSGRRSGVDQKSRREGGASGEIRQVNPDVGFAPWAHTVR